MSSFERGLRRPWARTRMLVPFGVLSLLSVLHEPAQATVTLVGTKADRDQFLALINAKSTSAITDANQDGVLEIGPPAPEGDNPFTARAREAITNAAAVTLDLGHGQANVFVGAWQPPIPPNPKATASNGTQVLDLDDIKALANPHSPACGIMHEMWEVFVAARDGDRFNNAHPHAIGAENTAHDKQGKARRGGAFAPPPTRAPQPTPGGGWYVYMAIGEPEFEGWNRLRIEGRRTAEPDPWARIAFGFLGPDELGGASSIPVPMNPQTGRALNDVYLAESVFIPVPPGDLDLDGDVDLDDFALFAACYSGSAAPPAPTCPPGVDADLDGDGDVDLDDFAIFAANYTGSQ